MATFQIRQRRAWLSTAMAEALEQYVSDPGKKAKPGDLLKRGAWYWLAYLKVAKVKSFDLPLWDLMVQEISTVRMVSFQVRDGRLLTTGGNGEVKEITALLDALALKLSGSEEDQAAPGTLDYAAYYRIDPVEVGLLDQLARMEGAGLVADIRSLKLAQMPVKLGTVKAAKILTDDYGGAKKLLAEEPEQVTAVEVQLKHPEKTWVTLGADGLVQVLSRATGTDCDFEALAVRLALEASQASADVEAPERPNPADEADRVAVVLAKATRKTINRKLKALKDSKAAG